MSTTAIDPNDPFQGRGVKLANGGWVPNDHPLAQQAEVRAPQPPGLQPTGAGTGTGAGGSIPTQAANASTYSQTPGAAPTTSTTNQGTQDVVRNSYLERATQGTTIDKNDPVYKQQVESFTAGQDRQKNQYLAETAERMSAQGLGESGAMDVERRMAAEKAGVNAGQFESQLAQRELDNRRNEIKDALSGLQGTLSEDQKLALQRELAQLDAAIKRESTAASTTLGNRELDLKDKLGMGALNVDLMNALLRNDQFGKSQALDWSKFDWTTNPFNPQNA